MPLVNSLRTLILWASSPLKAGLAGDQFGGFGDGEIHNVSDELSVVLDREEGGIGAAGKNAN